MQQTVMFILPLGIWASMAGGVVGVLATYFYSGQWRNWTRMLFECVPAVIFSAGLAEWLLPLELELLCFSASFGVGAIAGTAWDYWRRVAIYFIHNLLSKISTLATGQALPPMDVVKNEQIVEPAKPPEAPEPPPEPVALHTTPPQSKNTQSNQRPRKRKRR